MSMTITTYATLKTAMAEWLDRTDLTTRIPDFIGMFEAKINRRLRVRQQVTTASLTMTAGATTLPTDYLEWKRVTWQGSPKRELDYVTPSYLSGTNPDSISDTPRYFTIEGTSLKVAPIDNTSLVMAYAQKLPALSDSATTNWMLNEHPDGYLFGSLVMACTLISNAGDGAAWNALAEQILGEIWSLDFAGRGTLLQRAAGPTP